MPSKDKFAPSFGQEGIEWAPKYSEFRVSQGSGLMGKFPKRIAANFRQPFDYVLCFNCYAEALWNCTWCQMKFCHQEPCKKIHEASHTIALLANEDSN